MYCFKDTAPIVITGFIITVSAFVIHLIGFATPYWIKDYDSHDGLWLVCDDQNHQCLSMSGFVQDLPAKFKATQALECIAFIAYVAAVVCASLQTFVMKQRMMYIVGALTNFVAGGFSLIGCIIFSTIENINTSDLHFSFAFCIIASIGGVAAGVFFILAWKWIPAN
ncbi:uncharacterized protein [Mytilus edulis]|uniref:uncharacterized protein n=1 Tax=Mytilus edulis TaxID=6550 RepID=UPI0039F033E7